MRGACCRRLPAYWPFHFGVGVAIGADHLQVVGDVAGGFQFYPGDLHFARLRSDRRAAYVLRHADVLLAQVIDRGGEQRVGAHRLVLHTDFPLLAFGRLQRTGAVHIGASGGLERLRIGDVGRHAIVEDVAERRVAAELLVAAGIGGVALVVEGGPGVHPVLATAEGQAPIVEGDLVLDVEAGLVGLLLVVVEGRRTIRFDDRLAVDRVVDVARRRAAKD